METKKENQTQQKNSVKVVKKVTDNSVFQRVLCYDGIWRITKPSSTYLNMLESLAKWENKN